MKYDVVRATSDGKGQASPLDGATFEGLSAEEDGGQSLASRVGQVVRDSVADLASSEPDKEQLVYEALSAATAEGAIAWLARLCRRSDTAALEALFDQHLRLARLAPFAVTEAQFDELFLLRNVGFDDGEYERRHARRCRILDAWNGVSPEDRAFFVPGIQRHLAHLGGLAKGLWRCPSHVDGYVRLPGWIQQISDQEAETARVNLRGIPAILFAALVEEFRYSIAVFEVFPLLTRHQRWWLARFMPPEFLQRDDVHALVERWPRRMTCNFLEELSKDSLAAFGEHAAARLSSLRID